jgi:hypothetical protein
MLAAGCTLSYVSCRAVCPLVWLDGLFESSLCLPAAPRSSRAFRRMRALLHSGHDAMCTLKLTTQVEVQDELANMIFQASSRRALGSGLGSHFLAQGGVR